MPGGQLGALIHFVRRMGDPAGLRHLADGDLLERFTEHSDEAAFAAILRRHGPLVWGVCRSILHHSHDAEDVFQATFLVLVRRARSIRKRESLGSWLHGTAHRIAVRARAAARQRQAHSLQESVMPISGPGDEVDWELGRVLHDELRRLPEKYRLPVLLCYLEGRTRADAAECLGCTEGMVRGRLERARDLLRRRLTRRGVALSSTTILSVLSANTGVAAVPPVLADATVRIGMALAAGQGASTGLISANVVALSKGALQTMYLSQLKTAAVAILALGTMGVGTAVLTGWTPAASRHEATVQKSDEPQDPPKPPAAAKPEQANDAATERERLVALQSANNLRRLALAMHYYHDVYQEFPAHAICSKDGKPLLSWRVAILPYTKDRDLYKQFKLDEPWDSPRNKKLLERMPEIYAPIGISPPEPFSTFYQVFVGKGAAFEEKRRVRIADFSDSTSRTILIAEGGKAVPWTKPEDLPYAPDKPLPSLGGLFSDVLNVAAADGSVHLLPKKLDEKLLRALITRDGRENVDFEDVELRPRAQTKTLLQENARLRNALRDVRADQQKLMTNINFVQEILARRGDGFANTVSELARENTALKQTLEQGLKDTAALKAQLEKLKKMAAEGDWTMPTK
jgi:RNA polymerase sigma factor (sigma-70 family)